MDRSWIVRYLLYSYHGANEIEIVHYVFLRGALLVREAYDSLS